MATREAYDLLAEKRIALYADNISTLAELKHSIDDLREEVLKRRGR